MILIGEVYGVTPKNWILERVTVKWGPVQHNRSLFLPTGNNSKPNYDWARVDRYVLILGNTPMQENGHLGLTGALAT